MNAAATSVKQAVPVAGGQSLQPNEFDLRRITRMLETRVRYRYVKPLVDCIESGYRIQSPCCSRKIDATGGIIDVARLEYDAQHNVWNLYRKNHAQNRWEFHLKAQRLDVVMRWLNEDPARIFWQ